MELSTVQPSVLPRLYDTWMRQLLDGPIPQESHATCAQCAMAPSDDEAESQARKVYYPDTKCCTYVPTLPNFLVGHVLGDDDPALAFGRDTVGRRLHAGVAVTPFGISDPPTHALLYKNSSNAAFGRNRTVVCPHYHKETGGQCGIWRYRNAVCTTWFCKHIRGVVGSRFWQSLLQLLNAVEAHLATWCLAELHVEVDVLHHLFPPEAVPDEKKLLNGSQLDGVVNPVEYGAAWGKWLGQEREFYLQCARLVETLDWNDVVAVCGPEIRLLVKLASAAYRDLMTEDIPKNLRVHSFEVSEVSRGKYYVCAVSGSEHSEMPKALLNVLHYFDGRPYEEALHAIETEERIKLSHSLVRKLVDFGILVSEDKQIPLVDSHLNCPQPAAKRMP